MSSTATATTTTPTFTAGDEVTINHPRYAGQVWVISRVKVTKAILKPKGQPHARGLDAPLAYLRPHDPANPTNPTPAVQEIPIITQRVGEVVRLLRPFRANTTDTLMVVTSINQTTISLDPLGGVGGTPMRIPASGVVTVPLADILR